MAVPFTKPFVSGMEHENIARVLETPHVWGDGEWTRRCSDWLAEFSGSSEVLLTSSGTSALEMTPLLLGLRPGDEVIMPSFTFVTSASAFVRVGAVPVFGEVNPSTLNLDPDRVEELITPKTKAILVVHYAGVACDMERFQELCDRFNLALIEDAAQAFDSYYRGQHLGTIGDLGCISFHGTKNVVCGEGGALLLKSNEDSSIAHVIWEKGTNRRQYIDGKVDKYTWVELGSSFLPSEVTAAYLSAQLESASKIREIRMSYWSYYHQAITTSGVLDEVQVPFIPDYASHNAHIFWLLLPSASQRQDFMSAMQISGIQTASHYVPLHTSPAGQKYGRSGSLETTDKVASNLVRLPLWSAEGMPVEEITSIALSELKKVL